MRAEIPAAGLELLIPIEEVISRQFVSDKYGTATTHWDKLKERVNRGLGSPCPLILLGIPDSVLVDD